MEVTVVVHKAKPPKASAAAQRRLQSVATAEVLLEAVRVAANVGSTIVGQDKSTVGQRAASQSERAFVGASTASVTASTKRKRKMVVSSGADAGGVLLAAVGVAAKVGSTRVGQDKAPVGPRTASPSERAFVGEPTAPVDCPTKKHKAHKTAASVPLGTATRMASSVGTRFTSSHSKMDVNSDAGASVHSCGCGCGFVGVSETDFVSCGTVAMKSPGNSGYCNTLIRALCGRDYKLCLQCKKPKDGKTLKKSESKSD